MTYQVLARKWRPKFFATMVGQDHVVQALSNALDQGRLHHAYLFSGTRGVGKTTVARILAKSLNCEQGVSATPCGQCSTCLEIDQGRFIDLIEVDAASRTGVDDTRELLEDVSYAPTRGRYKVYLIDEVHMFSKSSFNALLKTLEEPPPHVKFLLATTDPQKLLPTVLSRCLQFNLKRVSVAQIAEHLTTILEAESIGAEHVAIVRLARAADGSIRDALSLLDQAIAFSQGKISGEQVDAMLGGVSQQRVYQLLHAINKQSADETLSVLAAMDNYSPDYNTLLSDLLALLHQIAVCQAMPNTQRESMVDPEQVSAFAQSMRMEDVQLYYQIALIGRKDMQFAPDEHDALEMVLLRMLSFQLGAEEDRTPISEETASILPQSPALQDSFIQPVAPADATANTRQASTSEAIASQAVNSPLEEQIDHAQPIASLPPQVDNRVKPQPTSIKPLPGTHTEWRSDQWVGICERLNLKGMYAQVVAHCILVSTDQHAVNLMLDAAHRHLDNPRMIQRVTEALSQLAGQPLKVNVQIGTPNSETPSQSQQRQSRELCQQARQSILDDPVVQDIQRRFDAAIDFDTMEIV